MPILVLQQPHTHAGKAYPAGEHIDVDALTAQWLLAHGIAAVAPAPSAPLPSKPSITPRKEFKS